MNYGASTHDWQHFDLILGLSSDLLPVVSNPNATTSDSSTLKDIGKTPSRYNRDRKVVGFPGWTKFEADQKYVAKWSAEPDYGVCIQTRNVRAIDVDISDPILAKEVKQFISDFFLTLKFPERYRENSSKFLLMFTMSGNYSKRILRLADKNIIEFLATGQQFIAVGTHPSGARYEWAGGLPYDIPSLAFEEFDALWSALAEEFNAEQASSNVLKPRDLTIKNAEATDDIAEYIDEHWQVLGFGKSGERYIVCPFEHDHTSESNATATAYFPKNTGGFEQGHFRCLHAHCLDKTDTDFLDAIGYRLNSFEVIPAVEDEEDQPWPAFKRDKDGSIKPSVNNVYLAVNHPGISGMSIRFDQFRDEIMFSQYQQNNWQPLSDEDYTRLRIGLEKRGFKPIGRELIRDVVLLASKENVFDSAINWINTLEWDGIPRVKSFLTNYFNAEQSEYSEAVSTYLWTALAGRVLVPGIKADMVPILVGIQGSGKSSAVEALSPDPSFFCEISFTESDDNLARKMRGRLVAEIGELRGLNTKDLESIKAFVTRTHENWIPKYREFATQFPRRLVFVGTTNQDEFLADDTGNRRWLPVRVSNVDFEAIKNDRLQLWAEAKELFGLYGIKFKDAERLATAEHEQYMIKDAWQDAVSKWLYQPDPFAEIEKPIDRQYLRSADVLTGALGFESKNIGRREEMRIGKTLQSLGYKKERRLVKGKNLQVYAVESTNLTNLA